jgi:iron complex outermembrane receptor protein
MAISIRCAFLAGTSALALFASASAQTPPAAARPKGTNGIEEVVVTAQRRSERLERVPVTATVVTSANLARRQIVTESDLQSNVPGLEVRQSRNSNELNYAIRGQSVDALSDSRPGVLPYINDVQFTGAGGSSAFYDLQSVQVLKGPQGTLFGRSSTGGAVLFTTQRPTNTFGGYFSQAFGDYGSVKTEGALNIPIVNDKVLLRLSGFYQNRDGFQYNEYDHSRDGGFSRYDGRASLTLRPTDYLTNDLVIDYYKYNGESTQGILYNFGPTYNPANPGAALPGAPLPIATLFGPPGNPLLGQGVGVLPGQQNIVAQLVQQYKNGPYVVDADGPNYFEPRSLELENTTTLDLAPDLQLKNIFGYGHFTNAYGENVTGTTITIDNQYATIEAVQYSEELQLLGKALDQNLTYVLGAYYSYETNHTLLHSVIVPQLGEPVQVNNYSQLDKTAALYAQATYSLANLTGIKGLGVTAGVRLTDETAENAILPGDVSYTPANLANPAYSFNQSITSRNVGWTLGVQEQLNPELLLYAVSRRSFKDAGFNGLNAPLIGIAGEDRGNAFGTETLTDGELGTKFSGQLGGMPSTLNAAVYIDDIRNAQHVAYTIGAGGAPAAITVNVPHAQSRGFEIDGQIRPVRWLTIGGSVNYIDAVFTNNVILGVPFGPVPDTPRWSESLFTQIQEPVTDDIDFFIGGYVYAQSSFYVSSTGNTDTGSRLPAYSITNLQVGFTEKAHGLSLTANVKNVFDRVYYAGGIAPAQLFNFNSVVPGEPRTFLIEGKVTF